MQYSRLHRSSQSPKPDGLILENQRPVVIAKHARDGCCRRNPQNDPLLVLVRPIKRRRFICTPARRPHGRSCDIPPSCSLSQWHPEFSTPYALLARAPMTRKPPTANSDAQGRHDSSFIINAIFDRKAAQTIGWKYGRGVSRRIDVCQTCRLSFRTSNYAASARCAGTISCSAARNCSVSC
jgi:hypothetical protein